MANNKCNSGALKKPNETMRLIITTTFGIVFGFLIGVSFPRMGVSKDKYSTNVLGTTSELPFPKDRESGLETQVMLNHSWTSMSSSNNSKST